MLPAREQAMLTALVDGELSPSERRAVDRLLERSPEARDLLRRLQSDARGLRELPRPRLGRDLSGDVVSAIRQRRLRPPVALRRVPRPVQAVPAWAGLAAAAAVLLAVGLSSYLYFAFALAPVKQAEIAKVDPKLPSPRPPQSPQDVTQPAPRPEGHTPEVAPRPVSPPLDAVALGKRDVVPPVGPIASDPPAPRYDEISAAPHMEIFKPESFTANLPLLLKLSELEKPEARQKFLGDLAKDTAFRVELPCRHGTRAFERFQAALKDRNIAVTLDPTAQSRLRIPQLKTNFVLYAEGVSPEDLTQLLRQASGEDRKSAKPQEPTQFDSLVVTRMTSRDRKELADLLGTDLFQPVAKPSGPLGTDPHKPLSGQTADQVAKSLSGQGGPPRPGSSPSAGKPPENTVLALAYNPVRPRAGSAEVKRFLESRKPTRPGTLQILLVLRGT